jgi:hypothetical protein
MHDRVRRFRQPADIVAQVLQFNRREELRAARRRPAQRLEQSSRHQDRNVVRVEAQEPGGFLNSEPAPEA